jgi:hypothetical protein
MRYGTGLKYLICRMVMVGVLTLVAFCCDEASGACKENGGQEGMMFGLLSAQEIVVEGRAGPDIGVNPSDIRQRAVENAQQQVLLDGVRPLIHPVVFSRETDYLRKVLVPKKNEALSGVEVVSEGEAEGGAFRVIVRAFVQRDRLEEILLRNLPSRKVVVITTDISGGRTGKGHILRYELTAFLNKKGYEVVDPHLQGDVPSQRFFSLLRAGDREAPKIIGLYFLAATVMEGSIGTAYSQETAGIFSSRSHGSMRVYKASSCKGPVSFSVQGIKGFGSDRGKSVSDATHKGAAALSVKAVKSLSEGKRKK